MWRRILGWLVAGGWWRPVDGPGFAWGGCCAPAARTWAARRFYGCLLAHHAISTLIWQAAAEADIDPDRVSFTRPDHPPDHRPQAARHDSGRVKRTSGKGTRHAGIAGHNRIFEVSRDVVTARLLWVISCLPAEGTVIVPGRKVTPARPPGGAHPVRSDPGAVAAQGRLEQVEGPAGGRREHLADFLARLAGHGHRQGSRS